MGSADLGAHITDAGGRPTRPPILELAGVYHSYGPVVALRDVALSVPVGEFLTLLGPSGSGKSTLLRIIAGLEEPTVVATMLLAGQDVRGVLANERNVATVFQHFALFPHMSAGENVEYGLRVRRRPPSERRRRALDALALVRLADHYDRRIHQLSGGEKQRVALARALVTEPDILLLDEPLGSLDERLRLDMQIELIELHKRLGATFILVTHSQEEAITMSDRIVLLRAGQVEQDGAPRELFERPRTRFVAQFMGVENLFAGAVTAIGDAVEVRVGETQVRGVAADRGSLQPGARVFVGVRAEHVRCGNGAANGGAARNELPCQPRSRVYKGTYVDIAAETPIGIVTARDWSTAATGLHAPSHVAWDVAHCIVGPE